MIRTLGLKILIRLRIQLAATLHLGYSEGVAFLLRAALLEGILMRCGLRVFALALGILGAAAPAARAADKDEIQGAVDRGVAYLKGIQQRNGTWPYLERIFAETANQTIGMTALAALTLLECNVPTTDPHVQNAAAAVRQSCPGMQSTYALALSIMLFDRLGDPADEPLIQAMGVRLLAGQNGKGGWSYICSVPGGEDEVHRLEVIAQQKNELVAKGKLRPGAPRKKQGEKHELPKEVKDQLALLNRQRPADPRPDDFAGWGDNSNTQFAMLGLWVAHRYGIPVEEALARTEQRFRRTQNGDFGWGYTPVLGGLDRSTPSMTCAGLLGLALGYGSAKEGVPPGDRKGGKDGRPVEDRPAREPSGDPAIRNGLLALSTAIGHPVGSRIRARAPIQGRAGGNAYYFLWSLERVAVAYGLDTIGEKDWYAWGSEILLVSQLPNGSWWGKYGLGGADTCFALLFLRRANFARDLSARLKGQIEDPGEVRLRAGGVGGAGLRKTLKSEVELAQVPPPEPPRKDKPTPPVKEKPSARPAESKEQSAEIGRLSKELVQARPGQRERLLVTYKVSPGVAYTQALAAAIPQLTGPARVQARDALAERLAHMNAATLRDKLRDEDLEIRRGAALACAMKDEKAFVPNLIPLLEDDEPPVAWAAHKALKSLTGRNLGPAADATRHERAKAVAAWKAWWEKNGSK
jgi:hypothetical protein